MMLLAKDATKMVHWSFSIQKKRKKKNPPKKFGGLKKSPYLCPITAKKFAKRQRCYSCTKHLTMKNFKISLPYPTTQIIAAKKCGYSPSSVEILQCWDYKADGLKVDEARGQLSLIRKSIQTAHWERQKHKSLGRDKLVNNKTNRKGEIERRRFERDQFKTKMANSHMPSEYRNIWEGGYQWKPGFWRSAAKAFRINENTLAWVRWDEDTDWDYYSNGKPKNTYSNRRVDFVTFDHKTARETVKTFPLENFAGDYLKKAIIWFIGAKPYKQHKLKEVQLSTDFRVKKVRQIGGATVFERYIKNILWDYCIFDGNTTYHNHDRFRLVDGLKKKLEAAKQAEIKRHEFDNKLFTAKFLKDTYGFCYEGMTEFCDRGGLDVEGEYTLKEIRAAAVNNRIENCKFKDELKTIGIVLNCK